MPTPERTSRDQIVAAGRRLLESGGLDALTMQGVAESVGVRAPSLYKRVQNRDELLRLVAEATVDDLATRLDAVTSPAGPQAELVALAAEVRRFAQERPEGYRLVFGGAPPGARPSIESLRRATARLLDVAEQLAGADRALEAARTVTAWLNGFVLMELAGVFRLGGDVDAAFGWGAERVARAVAAPS